MTMTITGLKLMEKRSHEVPKEKKEDSMETFGVMDVVICNIDLISHNRKSI